MEIWQANTFGRYNHERDSNPKPLDPNFQYWGKALTDEQGHYRFQTRLSLKPGAYPAGGDWIRPPHIHWKIQKRGYQELTIQTYFSDEAELNKKDRILRSLPLAEQAKVVIDFKESLNIKEGVFNIHLKGLI